MKRALIAVCLLPLAHPAARADPPLIPRAALFGNPARGAPQLSPDGKSVAYLAPSDKGVSNIWVEPFEGGAPRMATHDSRRGIYQFQWASDGTHLLYIQDRDGDENFHLFAADLAGDRARDLTPFPGARAQNLLTSPKRPSEVLVGLNLRDRRLFDMHRVNLDTGAVALEAQNPGDVLSWTTDENFVIRAATAFGGDDAHTTVRIRDDAKSPWRDLLVVPFEDCQFFGQVNGGSLVAGFAPGGKSLYVVSPIGSDKTRLVEFDCQTGKELRVLADDPRCDVDYDFETLRPIVLTDQKTDRVQAVQFTYLKPEWKVLDEGLRGDFDALAKAHAGAVNVIGRDKKDARWLVSYTVDNAPTPYFAYDRGTKQARLLFVDRPELEKYTLAKCEPVVVKARDGLDLICYLTLPPGVPAKNLPLVFVPHGGPWFRDYWGFDTFAQWLANRGYAVLQVNFRASIGFGKKHFNAGNRNFGDGAVMADMLDAIQWTIARGIADPKRVGVMGGSFGGYTTLCCIAFHPERFACGVCVVGFSDMATSLRDIPDYWKPVKKRWVRRMGDAEHDPEYNREVSPLYHVDRIRAPLLIGHGANDPRCNLGEAEQIVKAMREKGRPVTFVVYPDEGHGFARPENNLDFFGRAEEFLAQYLGGRKEPWRKMTGSTAELR